MVGGTGPTVAVVTYQGGHVSRFAEALRLHCFYPHMVNKLLPVVQVLISPVFCLGQVHLAQLARHRAGLSATDHFTVNLDNGHDET